MARRITGAAARCGARWRGFIEFRPLDRAVGIISALALITVSSCFGETDWERKDAWRQCDAAISGWPDTPAPHCAAMHMCANEAPLSSEARGKLARMITATPGCPAP